MNNVLRMSVHTIEMRRALKLDRCQKSGRSRASVHSALQTASDEVQQHGRIIAQRGGIQCRYPVVFGWTYSARHQGEMVDIVILDWHHLALSLQAYEAPHDHTYLPNVGVSQGTRNGESIWWRNDYSGRLDESCVLWLGR